MSVLPLAALHVAYPPAWYLRLASIAWFVLACVYLALLVRRLDGNRLTASLSVLAFGLFPLSIFFTRTVQPDGPALCLGIALLYHVDRWFTPLPTDRSPTTAERRTQLVHALAAGALTALVLLTKISNGFLALPAIAIMSRHRGLLGSLRRPSLWLWCITVLVPVALWYRHVRDFAWSFGIWGDRGASKFTNAEFFYRADVWKRLGERHVYEVLTWGGLLLLLVGLTRLRRSVSARLAGVWLLAVLLFILATLRGNNRHIYYSLPMVVPAAILVAHGATVLLQRGRLGIAVLAIACCVHGAITYEVLWGNGDRIKVTPYFRPVASLVEGIDLIRKHVPEGERFVSADRHPGLFYNSGRRGYFANKKAGAIMRCAEGETPYLVLDPPARKNMRKLLKRRPALAKRLRELEAGKHYAVWLYEPVVEVP